MGHFVMFLFYIFFVITGKHTSVMLNNLKFKYQIGPFNEDFNYIISTEQSITLGYFHFLSPHFNNDEVLFNIFVVCW